MCWNSKRKFEISLDCAFMEYFYRSPVRCMPGFLCKYEKLQNKLKTNSGRIKIAYKWQMEDEINLKPKKQFLPLQDTCGACFAYQHWASAHRNTSLNPTLPQKDRMQDAIDNLSSLENTTPQNLYKLWLTHNFDWNKP